MITRKMEATKKRLHVGALGGVLLLLNMVVGEATAFISDSQPLTDTEMNETASVFGEFTNQTYTSPPTGQFVDAPEATAFFGGSVCNTASGPPCPNDGSIYLQQSAFGQAVANRIPYPEFVQDTVDTARDWLFNSGDGALRYKELIYGTDISGDPTEVINFLNSRDASVSDYYDTAERDRLVDAERLLRNALKYAPGDRILRNILLDLHYERAVAEVLGAKELYAEVGHIRIEPPNPTVSVVDQEIALYDQVINGYQFAIDGYYELLRDPVGINIELFDPAAASTIPFGYYIFREEVPSRALHGTTYIDGNGQLRDVAFNQPLGSAEEAEDLFSGYKDFVMLFGLMADLAEAIKQKTRLLAMRGDAADIPVMHDLVKNAHEQIYLEGNVLLGIFPEGSLPPLGHLSGVQESIARWSSALTELTGARTWVEGDTNILGFSPDFLMLIDNDGAVFDSFDSIISRIKNQTSGIGLLPDAIADLEAAIVDYDGYRATLDALATEYQNRRVPYENRLIQLVGAKRCDITGEICQDQCDADGDCYNTPHLNQGSDIQLQLQTIDIANNRIARDVIRQENLIQEIEIEIDRAGQVAGINNAISNVYLKYGDKQAKLTDEITRARVKNAKVQAIANTIQAAIAGSSAGFLGLGGGVGAALGGASAAMAGYANVKMEERVGELNAQKERVVAAERAEVNDLNGDIMTAGSKAKVLTLWLQASVIALDIAESEMLLAQEIARLKSMTDEIASIESRMDQENSFIAHRYFADPVHRLRMQTGMIDSVYSFQNLQEWVFYAVRAFQYKWNEIFSHTMSGQNFSETSVYASRNANELKDVVTALLAKDSLLQSNPTDDIYTVLSLRDHIFGYRRYDVFGNDAMYPDPITGVSVDAVTAFRSALEKRTDAQGNIVIDFSTVRQLPGKRFFLGPRYDSLGNLLNAGLYLDKIEWLRIAVNGAHPPGIGGTITGYLTYGGTSFIRNQTVGTALPGSPDHIEGEMTAYSTRFWRFNGTYDKWVSQEAFTAPVPIEVTLEPDVPPTVPQIDVFKERSVATTGWKLVIPTQDLGFPLLVPSVLDDIQLEFYHRAYVR